MKLFIKENSNILVLYILWIIIGMISIPASLVFIPLTLIWLRNREMYKELLFGFLIILTLSDSRQHSLDFAKDLKDIYIVLLALFLYTDRKKIFPANDLIKAFFPFFIVAAICLFFSMETLLSFQKTLSYFLLFAVVPSYISYSFRTEGVAIYKHFFYLYILMFLAGIIMLFFNPDFVYLAGRYTGILGNPNGIGIFCLLFFFIYILIKTHYPDQFSRQDNLLALVLVITALYLAGSRTAIFGLLIFVLLSKPFRYSFILGFACFLLLILVFQFVSENIVTIVTALGLESFFRLETLNEGSGRLVAWNFAWVNIQLNFFLGKGIAYTEWLYLFYHKELSLLGHQGLAHNTYLTIWLDTGLIGLICYFGALIFKFIQGAKNTPLAFPILCSLLFSIFFESWLSSSLNPFTILVVIIMTLITDPQFLNKREEVPVPIH